MLSNSRNEGKGGVVVRDEIDIHVYPKSIHIQPKGTVVTLGDLHGNAAKLLAMLVKEGVIYFDPKRSYDSAITAYEKSDGAENTLGFFELFLNDALICIPCPKLRLIGDDLADRGKNDLLTLEVYRFLNEHKINFDVIASNHGVEFLKQYAFGIDQDLITTYQGKNASFGSSLHGLRKNITDGFTTKDKVNELIEKHYLPHIKLLSYLVTDDKKITIYSHAPINDSQICALASLFKVNPPLTDTLTDLTRTIDAINQAFSTLLQDRARLKAFFAELGTDPIKKQIFYGFINGRYHDLAEDNAPKDYEVLNVHGHVGLVKLVTNPVTNWTYCNIDSDFGKTGTDVQKSGIYAAFISHESEHALQLESAETIELVKKIKNEFSKNFVASPLDSTSQQLITLIESINNRAELNSSEKITMIISSLEQAIQREIDAQNAQNTSGYVQQAFTLFAYYTGRTKKVEANLPLQASVRSILVDWYSQNKNLLTPDQLKMSAILNQQVIERVAGFTSH